MNERYTRQHTISDFELTHAVYPGTLMHFARQQIGWEFRKSGHTATHSVEWEDEYGWHIQLSNMPLRRGSP